MGSFGKRTLCGQGVHNPKEMKKQSNSCSLLCYSLEFTLGFAENTLGALEGWKSSTEVKLKKNSFKNVNSRHSN